MTQVRKRRFVMLVVAILSAGAAWSLPLMEKPERIRIPVRFSSWEKNCTYAGEAYSWNACRGGQRCARGRDDEYYWEDDPSCPSGQTQGGFPVY